MPGATLLLRRARDSRGHPIGAETVGSNGLPKCEFIAQLVRVDEPENAELGGCWVGAHPSIGERLADALIREDLLTFAEQLPPAEEVHREVLRVAGCDMRADFLIHHKNSVSTILEVKTVVDTDYNPETLPSRTGCVFLGRAAPYRRVAIFPWGRASQKGPEGEKVVSARAIKHVNELAAVARGERRIPGRDKLAAALLFVVTRHDAVAFRPNAEACSSFAKHLAAAAASGVRVLAHAVRWGEGLDKGKAFWAGELDVDWSVPCNDDQQLARRRKAGASQALSAVRKRGQRSKRPRQELDPVAAS